MTVQNKGLSQDERQKQIRILLSDDESFSTTKEYLKPLILKSLSHFELTGAQHQSLLNQLLGDVRIAANRYLGTDRHIDADYKFSTYFTWYIAQRINKTQNLKRRRRNRGASTV